MKFSFFTALIVTIVISSCSKTDGPEESCSYPEDFETIVPSNKVFPLHRNNFWVYEDSLWSPDSLVKVKSTLLSIDKVYSLDNSLQTLNFSSILPPLTLKNDTLYSTLLYPNIAEGSCYELIHPMYFETTDTVIIDNDPSIKKVYPYPSSVTTPVGVFTNNMVYNEADLLEIIWNKNVGILKISFLIPEGNGKRKRRTLTLKSFDLN